MDRQKIEQVLSELEQPMIETLRTLVRIPSVKADPEPGAPFGRPAREALDKALEICADLGFECANIDGYAGHADLGEGKTEDALAVLGHLDVVPIGDNWTCEPFGAEIRDGKMYGRGTSDDKGPVVAALYAMAAIKRLGLPLKRKIRLIMGTDEESGWEDMRYYRKVCGMPRSGFSPDADYPVINIEKGSLHLDIWGKLSDKGLQVIRFDTGDRYNVVPGKAEALIRGDKALEICADLGFECANIDGYAGHADLGEGKTEDALAVLGHLDVVPIGDNWTCEPFGAEIRDGKMYGRGTSDDKGPVVAALYAMAAIKRLGLPLKRKIRLIMGTDEESGWEDMRYYSEVCGMPRSGFSPDADYPVINIEKGSLHLDIWGKLSDKGLQVIRFDTGDRYNVVPGKAEALIRGDKALADQINATDFGWQVTAEATAEGVVLRTEGIPGHAAMPEGTLNAIGLMLKTLKALGVEGDLKTVADVIGTEYDGKSLGIKIEDQVSGPLTSNMGIIRAGKDGLRVTLDLRCPILADLQGIADQAARALPGMKVEITSRTEPHYVSADSELVRKLLKAYEDVTGEKGYAMAIGGGTYAKCLEEGVAFGALFPGEPELAHHADEFISLDSLRKNLRIFTYALISLACEEGA